MMKKQDFLTNGMTNSLWLAFPDFSGHFTGNAWSPDC
jgi:hypothetical protein